MSPKVVKGSVWVHRYLYSLALIKKMNKKDYKRVWSVGLNDPSGEGLETQEFIKYLESKEEIKKVSEELKRVVKKDKEDFYKWLEKDR